MSKSLGKLFKINVLTLTGVYLKYTVSEYEVIDGFVIFNDYKTNLQKQFHGSRCEIEVIR